ncbi:MAG: hypothetical protein Q8R22_15680 [Flavobacterium sp.]|uniref:hypothetical protein n=1 Tax=Flavobacterium sp. TaxID=239 RepID=UPI002734ED5A|nr:hypothetical protein [Flavobacterium sp.]MDP3682266.1 hypothetical protein [Flavobacterium sp.]
MEVDAPEEQMLLAPENHDPNGDTRIHETAYQRREHERQATQQRYVDICAKFVAFNQKIREETAARVESMSEDCVADLTSMSTLWSSREAYRLEAEARNASLNYVLTRAKGSIQKALESEVVVEDPKKKGAKKK